MYNFHEILTFPDVKIQNSGMNNKTDQRYNQKRRCRFVIKLFEKFRERLPISVILLYLDFLAFKNPIRLCTVLYHI